MYFIITKSFLNSHSKEFLITAFNLTKNSIHKTKKVKPTIRGYLKIFGGTSNTNHITISKANLHFFKNQYVVELFSYCRFGICCVIHDISTSTEKLILDYITRLRQQELSCRYLYVKRINIKATY